MASPDASNLKKVHGWLVKDPTNLAGTFPYGGTALGLARDHEFRPNVKSFDVQAEEWGHATTSVLFTGQTPIFAAVLRETDADAIRLVMPGAAAVSGAPSRTITVGQPGSPQAAVPPGSFLDDKACVLLFAPKDPDDHDAILLYRAVAMPEESAALQLSLSKDVGLAVVFKGTVDGSGRDYAQALLGDLSL